MVNARPLLTLAQPFLIDTVYIKGTHLNGCDLQFFSITIMYNIVISTKYRLNKTLFSIAETFVCDR